MSGSSSTITSAAVPHTAQYLQRAPGNFRRRPFHRPSGATRNLPRTNTPPTTVCGYCRRHGHVERDCRAKRRDQQRNDRRPQSNLHHVADHAHGQYGIDSLQLFHSILNSMHVQFNDASEWLLDTDATHHMTPHQHLLCGYESFPASVQVFLGDNRSLNAVGLGYMPSGTTVKVRDVYYVPGLSRNILSVTAATLTGSSIEFFHYYCVVHFKLPSGHFETIKIQQKNRLYTIAISQQGPHSLIASTSTLSLNLTKATSTLLWHYRLGHINSKNLHQMRQKHLCHGLPDSLSPIDLCEGCLLGKASHKPFPRSQTRSTQLNQLVHNDLYGPMETRSLTGSLYFLTFVDDFCKYNTVYFLKLKSLVLVCFQDYCKQALRTHDIPIQVLRSDNRGEYKSNAFQAFSQKEGIQQQFTVAYSPQKNGVSERKNRTLVQSARAGLPKSYREKAVATACYLQNRIPHSIDPRYTPYFHWYGKVPNLDHLRIFGCVAYSVEAASLRQKLDTTEWEEPDLAVPLLPLVPQKGSPQSPAPQSPNPVGTPLPLRAPPWSLAGKTGSYLFPKSPNPLYKSSSTFKSKAQELSPLPDSNSSDKASQSPSAAQPDISSPSSSSPVQKDQSHVPLESIYQLSVQTRASRARSSMSPKMRSLKEIYESSDLSLLLDPSSDVFHLDAPEESLNFPQVSNIFNSQVFFAAKDDHDVLPLSSEPIDAISVEEALAGTDASKWKAAMDSEFQSLIDNRTWKLVLSYLIENWSLSNGC
ncbi:hypothetical protein L7F22_013299 [Adiantum nelumboides]|nr:hypothetical protein [Adiantum nelumboides]